MSSETVLSQRGLVWSDLYSVGDPKIDSQHQRLFELFTGLCRAQYEGQGSAMVEDSLRQLLDYTRIHFQDEERIMARSQYPRLGEHSNAHKLLLAQVENLLEEYEEGAMVLTEEVLIFLKNWLRDHILGMDMQLRDFLHSGE